MRYNFKDACPYCGQVIAYTRDGEDARDVCGCSKARLWCAMRSAIYQQSNPEGVFDEIEPDTVDMLFDIAHLIVAEALDGAVISLPDGSKMTIRDKVQRKKSVTLEAKN